MEDYSVIFKQCKQGNSKAQRKLYDLFKSRLMGLCRRYTKDKSDAQDVLQESFIKIFSNIHKLESADKLESWMKTTTVRVSIDFYKKNKERSLFIQPIEDEIQNINASDVNLSEISDEYLIEFINQLPSGCRMVFNLFVIEGYSHFEIAQMLAISEGTSRSQLHHSKYLLKEKFKVKNQAHYHEKFAG